MLEGQGLSFRHGRGLPWLFRGLDIRVEPGERLGLAGPSGAGKTSLGRVLAGYLAPAAGRVLLDGAAPAGRSWRPVQMLFQHPELAVNPRWKAGDIMAEAGPPDPGLLDRLAVAPAWLGRYPHELSGGELQRICLARALGAQPRYLVCDEMTSMLDALTQAGIWRELLAIAAERGLGLLVISHDPALLARTCTRTVQLPGPD